MCEKEDWMHVARIMASNGHSQKYIAEKLGVSDRMAESTSSLILEQGHERWEYRTKAATYSAEKVKSGRLSRNTRQVYAGTGGRLGVRNF